MSAYSGIKRGTFGISHTIYILHKSKSQNNYCKSFDRSRKCNFPHFEEKYNIPTDRQTDRPDHKRWAYVYIVSILVSCMHARLCHRCTKLQETKSKKQTNKYSIRILEDLLSRQQSSMLLEVAAYGKA